MSAVVIKRAKRILLGLGVFLIISAILLLMLMISGVANLPEKLFAGEATVHTVARLAVVGCLLAAIGTHE